jgi:hypothetical protein
MTEQQKIEALKKVSPDVADYIFWTSEHIELVDANDNLLAVIDELTLFQLWGMI